MLQGNMKQLVEPKITVKRGTGFGGPKLSKAEKLEALRVETLQTQGVCLIRNGLTLETAVALKNAALEEVKSYDDKLKYCPRRTPPLTEAAINP